MPPAPLAVATPRHLVRFHPKRVPHMFTDVLILGAGIAGIRAALAVRAVDPGLDVVVISKDALRESNSAYAQGGIAGVLDPEDDFGHHAADTVAAGKGLCHPDVVELVVREAPERIEELVEYGADFDRVADEHGVPKLALTREGGHSHRRIVHALGDATGWEVMRAMRDRVRQAEGVGLWERTFLLDLLTEGAGDEARCAGALVWSPTHGKTVVWAKSTVLCTGGCGRLFRETTNPDIATADGHAAAFRAGAELRDMEFMQFHPTVLYIAGGARHLISEAVRGEGAHLLDAAGRRFMGDYSEALELAPRDEVSRAITDVMEKTGHPCVYLSLAHLDPALVAERFPNIGETCRRFGLDIQADRIPVRPGAHYMIGGVTTDVDAATSLPGLWAAGEATSSGLHGANRLASNSLLEGLVFGKRAGERAGEHAADLPDRYAARPLSGERADPAGEPLDVDDLRRSLASLMTRRCGIARDAAGLAEAAGQTGFWAKFAGMQEFDKPAGWELQNHAAGRPVDGRRRRHPRGEPRRALSQRLPPAAWGGGGACEADSGLTPPRPRLTIVTAADRPKPGGRTPRARPRRRGPRRRGRSSRPGPSTRPARTG